MAKAVALFGFFLLLFFAPQGFSADESQAVLGAGDSFVFQGLNFTLKDAGAGTALFELRAGSASSVLFARKNSTADALGVRLFVEDYAPGKVKVVFSNPSGNQTQSNASNASPGAGNKTQIQEELTLILNSTQPESGLACVEEKPDALKIERRTRVFQSPEGIFTLVEFRVKNEGSSKSSAFLLKDEPTGKSFAVDALAPFDEKVFSFVARDEPGSALPSVSRSGESSLPLDSAGAPWFLYAAFVIAIFLEAFAVKHLLDARKEA